MRQTIMYDDISDILNGRNIFFSVSGNHRHKPNDYLFLDDNSLNIEPYCAFLSGNHLYSMGSFSYSWSALPINTRVGRYCSIAGGVSTLGTRHPIEWISSSSVNYDDKFIIFKKFADDMNVEHIVHPRLSNMRKHGLIIGDDVWIGANVTLKNDIVVGTGAVIAANSVVIKDVPPYAIVGGNPAKIIKYRFSDYQIIRLLSSKWWEYAMTDIQRFDIRNIDQFCDTFLKEKQNIQPYQPSKLTFLDLSADKK